MVSQIEPTAITIDPKNDSVTPAPLFPVLTRTNPAQINAAPMMVTGSLLLSMRVIGAGLIQDV
jgi:hypothetical protein